MCDLVITINNDQYYIDEVGIRMKGNTSRNSNFVTENGDIVAPVHFKISVSQTFDDEEDNEIYPQYLYYTVDYINDISLSTGHVPC